MPVTYTLFQRTAFVFGLGLIAGSYFVGILLTDWRLTFGFGVLLLPYAILIHPRLARLVEDADKRGGR